MDVIEGVVSKLRGSIEVSSGGGEYTGTDTKHVVTFQLGDQAVRFKSKAMPVFVDGDYLVVAGNPRNGLLEALAYRNASNGVVGDAGSMENWVIAFVMMIGGLIGILFGLSSSHGKPVAAVGLLAMVAGVVAMVFASKPGDAIELVQRRSIKKTAVS